MSLRPFLLRASAAILVSVALASSPTASAQRTPTPSSLLLGTAWYPEQWPENVWEHDLDLMQKAGIHVVRVGEFAWSTMEPTEGHLDFTWLDHAIAAAAKRDIYVVLGTPTAAPPAWLTSKYPETLRVEEDGRRAEHGNRQQFSPASLRYRQFAKEIATRMAQRYGHNPHVLGWQIDNEIAAPTFDEAAKTQWHTWLQHKYGTVDELNRRWTTAYWSQTYNSFDQVPFHSHDENPALLLDYKRFVTETWRTYIDLQADAIRAAADKRQFITTNTMGWFNAFDHYIVHKNLDIAAWDDYVPDGKLDMAQNGLLHDLVRGYKQRNFWLMETQPSFVNWGPVNVALPPGVVREMAWQAVGHGADAVLYWQWRSALNGQEQYHGTLVAADGEPVPIYDEIARLGTDFQRAGNALAGTAPVASVAMLQDYPSHWAIDFQRHNREFDYTHVLTGWYRAVRPRVDGVDVVPVEATLDRYKVVLAPALNVISAETAQHLRAYVENGGTLVLGPRSGMKDPFNALWSNRQPGPLADLLGVRVQEFYPLNTPTDTAPRVSGALGSGTAIEWAELLQPTSPETTAALTYGESNAGPNGWLAGHPAAVSRKVGKGTVLYIGAVLDPAATAAALGSVLKHAGVQSPLTNLPEGVEVMERAAAGHAPLWIVINHGSTAQTLTLPQAMRNMLVTGSAAATTLALEPHGVAVLEERGRP